MECKDLYEQAWNDWVFYWEEGGCAAMFCIETSFEDSLHCCSVSVYVRNQMLVHKFSGETEEDMWLRGVSELLKAGAVKIYESTIHLARGKHTVLQPNLYRMYPLTPSDLKNNKP